MDNLDIAALADRIRNHRFDGYTDNMLADEIDRFRSGEGISGIADAVDALNAVASALTETEDTLRTELGKLGVEWHSEAGSRAGVAVESHASFSEEAAEKVHDSAERIFAQGEAFNRTLHALPDSRSLREGAGGYTTLDSVISLLGFETDNVVKVARAREAREQATQALNAYARLSGENLAGMRELESQPGDVRTDITEGVPGSIDAGGGPGDVTIAAGAGASAPAPSNSPVAPTVTSGAGAQLPASAVPAPQAPVRAAGSGSTGSPSGSAPPATPSTTAPSSASASSESGGAGFAGQAGAGSVGSREQLRAQPGSGAGVPAGPGSGASVPPERVSGGIAAGLSGAGQAAGRAGAVPGAVPPAGGFVGKPPVPGAGVADGQEQLPRGRSFGAAPQPPGPQPGGLSGATTSGSVPKPGVSANDLGAGATAIGAGGVAGALSGEGERRGRGVGRSAPGAVRSPRQFAIDDLPEEEATVRRGSERLEPGSGGRREEFLERAVTREGESDEGHVRRFGVDDKDLFTDDRMVAVDLIGDDDADGRL